MLGKAEKAVILKTMDRQLCAAAKGESAAPITGFAGSTEIELDGIGFSTICAALGVAFSSFEEALASDQDFKAACESRNDQISEMIVAKAVKSAFNSDKPRDITAVAERMNQKFAPSKAGVQINNNMNIIEGWFSGKDGAAIQKALEHFEEQERLAIEADRESSRMLEMIEAKAEVVE
jgi:hypothetical protein